MSNETQKTTPYTPRNLQRWTLPKDYFGESWPEYYRSGFGQHRDSDALDRSNFAVALEAMGGESDTVLVVEESHWAVGWVSWIAIHESDETALRIADKLNDRIADYPVLDEMDWSQREYDEACEYWESMPVRARAEYCKRAGVSIFAARRPCIPQDDDGSLLELLRGN